MNKSLKGSINYTAARKNIIWCQCTGMLPLMFLINGFMLNYCKKFGLSDSDVMLSLTVLPNILMVLLILPVANLSDKFGKKKLGNLTNILCPIAYLIILSASYFKDHFLLIVSTGLIVYQLGHIFTVSNWFALMEPLIERGKRGRFLAVLRSSWQVIALIATMLSSWAFSLSDDSNIYRSIIIILTLFCLIRAIFYGRIPEVQTSREKANKFSDACKHLLHNKKYIYFCIFCFLIAFLGSSLATTLNLYQIGALNFSESNVLTISYINMAGATAGFWLGGWISDKYSHDRLFKISTLVITFFLICFTFTRHFPVSYMLTTALIAFLINTWISAMHIGISGEAMHVVDERDKSFGISMSFMQMALGTSVSSILCMKFLDLYQGRTYLLMNLKFNHYEVLLAIMSLVMFAIFIFGFFIFRNK